MDPDDLSPPSALHNWARLMHIFSGGDDTPDIDATYTGHVHAGSTPKKAPLDPIQQAIKDGTVIDVEFEVLDNVSVL